MALDRNRDRQCSASSLRLAVTTSSHPQEQTLGRGVGTSCVAALPRRFASAGQSCQMYTAAVLSTTTTSSFDEFPVWWTFCSGWLRNSIWTAAAGNEI